MLQRKTPDRHPRPAPAAPRRGRPIRWAAWGVAALLAAAAAAAGGASGRATHDAPSAPTPPALLPTGAPALAMQAMAAPGQGRTARPSRPGVLMFSVNKLTSA